MLDVFFTVDVEVWCDGWNNIDERFPSAFRKYIFGPTVMLQTEWEFPQSVYSGKPTVGVGN